MKLRFQPASLLALLGWWGTCVPLAAQSIRDQLPEDAGFARTAGQNVQPFFEGWQRLPDGHIVMWFGYLNRNYQEELDIPIGLNNKFDLKDDMDQPTHFYTRRRLFVFKVAIPADWPADKRLTWTLTANGRTSAANGWMQPEWEVDEGVMQMNIGPGGAPPINPPNTAPRISVNGDTTIEAGKPLKLTASATDDGIPTPRNLNRNAVANNPSASRQPLPPGAGPPPRAQIGLRIRWILYRAPAGGGRAVFEPDTTNIVAGGTSAQLATQATFSAPGMYWLRAIASDGMLETAYDLRVTVIDRQR
jgi:hypothetical protein